jgi:hypothetical protein
LPSLSIREGPDGRVLVYCFAGCALAAILAALGLASRDLFAGPPPSPQQAAALRLAREVREQAERAQRQTRRDAWDCVRKWEAVVNALGAKLAHRPDDESLGRIFHTACDRMRESETLAKDWNPAQTASAQGEESSR